MSKQIMWDKLCFKDKFRIRPEILPLHLKPCKLLPLDMFSCCCCCCCLFVFVFLWQLSVPPFSSLKCVTALRATFLLPVCVVSEISSWRPGSERAELEGRPQDVGWIWLPCRVCVTCCIYRKDILNEEGAYGQEWGSVMVTFWLLLADCCDLRRDWSGNYIYIYFLIPVSLENTKKGFICRTGSVGQGVSSAPQCVTQNGKKRKKED